jgi:hypothetical protein
MMGVTDHKLACSASEILETASRGHRLTEDCKWEFTINPEDPTDSEDEGSSGHSIRHRDSNWAFPGGKQTRNSSNESFVKFTL